MTATSVEQRVAVRAPRFPAIDKVLALLTELPAAVLVLVEFFLLLSGVIARYVFHSPIGWADELAAILFVWLSLLGAAIATQRGEHMRLSFLLDRLPPRQRAWAVTFGTLVSLTFLLAMLRPALQFVEHESIVRTPALDISNGLRVAALAFGFTMMIVSSLVRLLRESRAVDCLSSVGIIALAYGLFHLAAPTMRDWGTFNLLVYFGLTIVVCLLLGVPIGFAFGIATVAYILFATRAPLLVVVGRMEEGGSHFILLAVPLFVVMGVLMELTGLARVMVQFLASLVGHVRGGLNYVLLGGMYLVSGISGSKVADMAAIAPVLFPEMNKRQQKPGEMVALLATSGAMAETIPPSLVLITVGSVTSVSIAALFTGGLLPALVVALMLALVAHWRSRGEDLSQVVKTPARQVWRSFLIALPALSLPFVIRAFVVEGIATATEVATIGIAYTVLLGIFVYRQFDVRRIYRLLVDTASLSGAILFVIATATAMAWALTQSGFSRDLAQFMANIPGGAIGFLMISIAAFIVLGSVLEGIPALVVFAPLLFPIARSMGIHEVHYAMVVILAMSVGLFAPPFGVGYYIACAIGKVSPSEAIRPIWAYLAALLAGLALVAAVPWLSIGFL